MKNPSPLLLIALVGGFAPFARAADRCDAAWLKKAQAIAAQGGTPTNENKYLKDETLDGGTRSVLDVASAPKVCDAAVWHYLVSGGTAAVAWNDDGIKQAWAGGLNEQLKILLTVNDLYQLADAQALEVNAKADAVVAAAAKIEKSDAGAEDLKASLSLLLADAPAPKAKPGEKPAAAEPVPGSGVLAFRKAVIGLASELAVRAATRKLADARGVDAKMTKDFSQGAGAMFAAPGKRTGKAGKSEYPDSVATDKGYAYALKYLTDPAITDANDAGAHDGVALSRLDYSLRNQIALRAAAVDQAVAAAKKRLNGRSVRETLAGVGRDATGAAAKKEGPAQGALGAEVLSHLLQTKEYAELNTLYDNKSKADPAWAGSDQGKAVAAQMKGMRDDAGATTLAATGKGLAVQYTVGGSKVTDTGILVADLKSDKQYREFITGAIASNIATDGKTLAFLAALRGEGAPGTAITPPLTPEQQEAAKKLPPPEVKPAQPALSAWDALAKATPGAGIFGWFSSKETAERYAAHQHEEASDIASAASRVRAQKERELNFQAAEADRRAKADEERRVAQAASKAKQDEERLRQAPQDPDLAPAEAARLIKEQVAAREKAAAEEQAKIRSEAAAAKAARDAEAAKALKVAQEAAAKAKAEADAKLKLLDETVDKAYVDGIARSETQLHGAYKAPGDARRSAAEKLSGYTGQFYRLERVDKYFADTWEGDKLPGATASCKTKLGFKMPVASGEGFKDPSPDNVDGYCGVRDGLVALLNSYRGSVKAPVAAPAGGK